MKKPRPPKQIGRKRRAAGWTMLTLGVIVAGVWAASGWIGVDYTTPTWQIDVGGGAIRRMTGSGLPPLGWRVGSHSPWWYWMVDEERRQQGSEGFRLLFIKHYTNSPVVSLTTTVVVLWPLPLLLLATGIPILRSGLLARRRAMTGSCLKCGYSLAGLGAHAPCPECGKAKAD